MHRTMARAVPVVVTLCCLCARESGAQQTPASTQPARSGPPSAPASAPTTAPVEPAPASAPAEVEPPAASQPSPPSADDQAFAALLAPPTAAAPAPSAEPTKRLWTWVAAGSAGSLGLAALVVGLNARTVHGELEQRCAPACPPEDADRVGRRAAAADVLLTAAVASAAISLVLYFVEGRSPTRAVDVSAAGSGVSASVRY